MGPKHWKNSYNIIPEFCRFAERFDHELCRVFLQSFSPIRSQEKLLEERLLKLVEQFLSHGLAIKNQNYLKQKVFCLLNISRPSIPDSFNCNFLNRANIVRLNCQLRALLRMTFKSGYLLNKKKKSAICAKYHLLNLDKDINDRF